MTNFIPSSAASVSASPSPSPTSSAAPSCRRLALLVLVIAAVLSMPTPAHGLRPRLPPTSFYGRNGRVGASERSIGVSERSGRVRGADCGLWGAPVSPSSLPSATSLNMCLSHHHDNEHHQYNDGDDEQDQCEYFHPNSSNDNGVRGNSHKKNQGPHTAAAPRALSSTSSSSFLSTLVSVATAAAAGAYLASTPWPFSSPFSLPSPFGRGGRGARGARGGLVGAASAAEFQEPVDMFYATKDNPYPPAPFKNGRQLCYSVEFTDPPSMLPRTTQGEDSAIKRLASMDVVIIGCHTHSPPPLSLYPSSPNTAPTTTTGAAGAAGAAGGMAGGGVGGAMGGGVSARGRDVSERFRYSNGRMPIDRVSYDDAALLSELLVKFKNAAGKRAVAVGLDMVADTPKSKAILDAFFKSSTTSTTSSSSSSGSSGSNGGIGPGGVGSVEGCVRALVEGGCIVDALFDAATGAAPPPPSPSSSSSSSNTASATATTTTTTTTDINTSSTSTSTMRLLSSLLNVCRISGMAVAPLGLDKPTTRTILSGGLASLPNAASLIPDPTGFTGSVQGEGFRRYTNSVIRTDYSQAQGRLAAAGGARAVGGDDYFSNRILLEEATASAAVNALRRGGAAAPLLLVVTDVARVRFGYGLTERVKRLVLLPTTATPSSTEVTAAASSSKVASLLLNPSAEDSLSTSNQLRLSLGYGIYLPASRPLADYVWYLSPPPSRVLTKTKNPISREGDRPEGESSVLGAF